jgi:hypothetical protein
LRNVESELVSSGVVEWGPFLILLKTSITAKILTLSRVLITVLSFSRGMAVPRHDFEENQLSRECCITNKMARSARAGTAPSRGGAQRTERREQSAES